MSKFLEAKLVPKGVMRGKMKMRKGKKTQAKPMKMMSMTKLMQR